LFGSLPWSSAQTSQALKVRLEQEEYTIAELDPLFDIDIADDLPILEKHLAAQPSLAPATRAWCLQNRTGVVHK